MARKAGFFEEPFAESLIIDDDEPKEKCRFCKLTLLGIAVRLSFIITVVVAGVVYGTEEIITSVSVLDHTEAGLYDCFPTGSVTTVDIGNVTAGVLVTARFSGQPGISLCSERACNEWLLKALNFKFTWGYPFQNGQGIAFTMLDGQGVLPPYGYPGVLMDDDPSHFATPQAFFEQQRQVLLDHPEFILHAKVYPLCQDTNFYMLDGLRQMCENQYPDLAPIGTGDIGNVQLFDNQGGNKTSYRVDFYCRGRYVNFADQYWDYAGEYAKCRGEVLVPILKGSVADYCSKWVKQLGPYQCTKKEKRGAGDVLNLAFAAGGSIAAGVALVLGTLRPLCFKPKSAKKNDDKGTELAIKGETVNVAIASSSGVAPSS